jgi:hypothetical protein
MEPPPVHTPQVDGSSPSMGSPGLAQADAENEKRTRIRAGFFIRNGATHAAECGQALGRCLAVSRLPADPILPRTIYVDVRAFANGQLTARC